jgi:tetratricopeptide (TPR) repeat protein
MGETQKAIDAFNKTTQFNRFDIEAWYANAEINARIGKIGTSIALLTEALEYMPDFAELIFTLSGYYLLADQFDQGLDWFKIAYDLDPENYKMVYSIYPQAEQMIEIQLIINEIA